MAASPQALLDDLLGALERRYASEARGAAEETAIMRRAAAHLARLRAGDPHPGSGTTKPACRFLGTALAAAKTGPLADVAAAFERALPALDWRQNANYSAAVMGERFVDRYCSTEAVGPGRPYDSAEYLVGFIILGSDLFYPDHQHPAAEVYHVISGTAEWWREGRQWQAEAPGSLIYHAPNVRHAMRMGAEPLLALYLWSGDISMPARPTRPDEMEASPGPIA